MQHVDAWITTVGQDIYEDYKTHFQLIIAVYALEALLQVVDDSTFCLSIPQDMIETLLEALIHLLLQDLFEEPYLGRVRHSLIGLSLYFACTRKRLQRAESYNRVVYVAAWPGHLTIQ